MSLNTSVESLLRQLASLLIQHGEDNWGPAIKRMAEEYQQDPEQSKSCIRRWYAGMGSFSDLVLHDSNGSPLRKENDDLRNLQLELYRRCQPDTQP